MLERLTKAAYLYLYPEAATYQQGSSKNIALFAARRGGSSILSQLIASDTSIREIDQPFDIFQSHTREGRSKIANLPSVELSQYFDLNSKDQKQVADYMNTILNGGLKELSHSSFSKKSRTLLKLVNTPFLLDEFKEKFDLQVVYIVRHPIPQALSVMRNKWGITVAPYLDLNHREFMYQFLTKDQLEYAEKIMKEGSYFEQAILNWVFENLFPLKFARSLDLKISYEDLVRDRESVVSNLESTLGLKIDPSVLDDPSRSSSLSESMTRKAIQEGDKDFLLNRWKDEITKNQLDQTSEILDIFGVSEYHI